MVQAIDSPNTVFSSPGHTIVEAVLASVCLILLLLLAPLLSLWPALLTLAAYVMWHGIQGYRFYRWLKHPKRSQQPFRIGIWRDLVRELSRIRNREKTLKKRLRRVLGGFQQSTRALPDATLVLTDKWEVEWWNPAAQNIFGISRKSDQPLQFLTLTDDQVFISYLEGEDFAAPIEIPAPADDSISLEVRVVPYGQGKHLIQARDITRLNQLEVMRRDFVANVSHELRTPLTVVHGYIESMLDSDGDDDLEQWKPILGQMDHQSGRLQRIVEDLLTLSRLESRDRNQGTEYLQVSQLIKRIADSAKSLSGDTGHEIQHDLDPNLYLRCHPQEIESAFSNLVFNAVRYTQDRGHILLRWQESDNSACFSVSDNGAGIDARHLPRLTERFYRVDVGRSREKGGTGLGLAIVKHVLIRHGATLEIDSDVGVGSTFSCHFPLDRTTDRQH